MSFIIDGFVQMTDQFMSAAAARGLTEDCSRNYKMIETRCNELTSRLLKNELGTQIADIKTQIADIKTRISNLNSAEACTIDYMESNLIGKIDPRSERVIWMIDNLKIAYKDLLEQQEANFRQL